MKSRLPKISVSLEKFAAVLVAGMIAIIAMLLKFVQPKTDFKDTLLLGLLVIALVTLPVIIATSIFQHDHDAEVDKILQKLHGIIPANPYKWLFPEGEVTMIESRVKCNSIWVITYNLHNDLFKDHVKDCVKGNMRRGIHYTYILPNSSEIIMLKVKFSEIYKEYEDKWKIILVDEGEFKNMTSADIVIYNPDLEDVEDTSVYIQLPVDGPQSWVKVKQETVARYIGRFREIVDTA